MRTGVLPLNAFVAFFYIMVASIALFILKKAVRSLPKMPNSSKNSQQQTQRQALSYDWLMMVSWAKKYTLIGSCFGQEKKYLLKEFLFMSVYAVSCLGINHIIFWPVALSAVCLPVSFGVLEVLMKKIEEKQRQDQVKTKTNAVNPQVESEIEIESVHIQELIGQNVNHIVKNQSVKTSFKKQRSMVELFAISAFCFSSVAMLLETVVTLGNSVSNSGQLNIISVLVALSIDQFAIRPILGVVVWCTYKIVTANTGINPAQLALVQLFCSEEVTHILIQNQKARIKKQTAMTASPPKKKTDSPSRVPKALLPRSEAPTLLNLMSMQPTKRNAQVDEQIQEIYLTTAEKQLFEGKENLQNKSGMQTRRKGCKQNHDGSSLSAAHRGTTIDMYERHEFDDMMIIQDDPLHEIAGNHMDEFYLQDSRAYNTKRKGTYKKKNKRNLKLTGSSPYLEYLPDMLKKVDKYKNDPARKEKRIL